MTKEPKLEKARRIVQEWRDLDQEATEAVRQETDSKKVDAKSATSSSLDSDDEPDRDEL